MRFDLDGFFWTDEERVKGVRNSANRTIAPIPETGWEAPKEFPNLFNEHILGVDVETYDPELLTHGPGFARGSGHIVGVSVSTDVRGWYFPVRHELQPEDNMDIELVYRYLRDLLCTNIPKVGANISYDKGWLNHEGIDVEGKLYDVQYAEALLYDTAKSYDLDSIARRWLGDGKSSKELYEWCAKSYGGKPNGKQRRNIYRSPPCLVGKYAEEDAHQPVQILQKQYYALRRALLWELFEMECELIPVLLGMRSRGLPVDPQRAEEVEVELEAQEETAQLELNILAGFDVGVYVNGDLRRLFDKFSIQYPYTKKGNPSFTQKFLTAEKSRPAGLINEVRKLSKARTTFVRNAILNKQVNGFLHPSFHPLRGEDGGAVSGRYSSSMPNAQQIPAKDEVLAPLIRSLFVPEPGYPQWIKLDLSQIEYRMFAHYSGDAKLIMEYQDPTTDYHNIVSGFLNHLLIRTIIKNFNFMSLYGGGEEKTINMIAEELDAEQISDMIVEHELEQGSPRAAAILGKYFVDLYAEKFPAAKRVMQEVSQFAQRTGEVRTILNRRSTFNLWEPVRGRKSHPLPKDKALDQYGQYIKRAATYKALNRKLQGSAADLLKKGMLDAYKAGLFDSDRLGFPHVTVHDELDFSYHPDLKKDFYELKCVIENAIPLKVPVIMDVEIGTNWGNVKQANLTGE